MVVYNTDYLQYWHSTAADPKDIRIWLTLQDNDLTACRSHLSDEIPALPIENLPIETFSKCASKLWELAPSRISMDNVGVADAEYSSMGFVVNLKSLAFLGDCSRHDYAF
jgi:hypothetical protein